MQRVSPNKRLHHMTRARLNRLARFAGEWGWAQAGRPRATGPVRVTLVLHRGRSIDQANAWAACKGALDGVFVNALTPDDSPRWLRLGEVIQEPGKEWRGRERAVFVVEEVAGG